MDIKYENWTVVRKLGTGSFGSVYEIEREDFGVYKAALKIISIPQHLEEVKSIQNSGMSDKSISDYYSSMVEELVREVALMSKLKGNTNIVSYEDHKIIPHKDDIGWDIYIRMELLTPLEDHIQEHPLSEQEVARLGISICYALERCQKLNVIHRDIKPGNIFISDQGDFKLGDFGIARTMERTVSNMSRKGTVNYMAPEVYNGIEYGLTVDIYSLGLVMYRLLNHNRIPFLPPYPEQIRFQDQEMALFKRINGAPLPYPDNSTFLGDVVLKACAYNPKDRFQNPASFRHALERVAERSWEITSTIVPIPNPSVTAAAPSEAFAEAKAPAEPVAADDQKAPVATVSQKAAEIHTEANLKNNTVISKKAGSNSKQPTKKAAPPVQKNDRPNNGNNRKKLIGLIVAVMVIIILLVVLLPKNGTQKGSAILENTTVETEAVTTAEITTAEITTIHLVELKDYTGQLLTDVQTELEAKGLVVKAEEADGTEAEGTVLEQSIKAGTSAKDGETITLTVSRGNQLVVPSFKNKSIKKLKSLLEGVKIIVADEVKYDEKVTPGNVASMALLAEDITSDKSDKATEKAIKKGDILNIGATVRVYTGGIKIPENIVGITEEEARTVLTELGLDVAEENISNYDYSDLASYGCVMSLIDENGNALSSETVLAKGTAVKLQINYWVYQEPVYYEAPEPVNQQPVTTAPPETEYYDF